jgi:hypothetical protein
VRTENIAVVLELAFEPQRMRSFNLTVEQTMANLLKEQLISIRDASALIPGSPHISTIWRWILRGVKGHRLESISVGGRRFTSKESVNRFLESLNCSLVTTPDWRPGREAAIEAASREIEASS